MPRILSIGPMAKLLERRKKRLKYDYKNFYFSSPGENETLRNLFWHENFNLSSTVRRKRDSNKMLSIKSASFTVSRAIKGLNFDAKISIKLIRLQLEDGICISRRSEMIKKMWHNFLSVEPGDKQVFLRIFFWTNSHSHTCKTP